MFRRRIHTISENPQTHQVIKGINYLRRYFLVCRNTLYEEDSENDEICLSQNMLNVLNGTTKYVYNFPHVLQQIKVLSKNVWHVRTHYITTEKRKYVFSS